jgi:hypothetical protein
MKKDIVFLEEDEIVKGDMRFKKEKKKKLHIYTSQKRMYIVKTEKNKRDDHIIKVNSIHDVSIRENKIKKSPAVLVLSILMLAVAITFMLVKSQTILGQIGIYLCIFGGIGVLIGSLLLIPKYDTVLTVVTTGYPVEISIDHLNSGEKKELRARLFELLVDEPEVTVAECENVAEAKNDEKVSEIVEPKTKATIYEIG